jgi:hypothetical protein
MVATGPQAADYAQGGRFPLCLDKPTCVLPSLFATDQSSRDIAGCVRFFTLIQCFWRPPR